MPDASSPPPPRTGIGLRAPHYGALLEAQPGLAFVEVHPENYLGSGGAPLHFLERARARYPLSLHSVGLDIGATGRFDARHLRELAALIARTQPALVSTHLCWSGHGGVHHHDLLPLPYTPEALAHVARRVEQVQDRLDRQVLVENVSSYLECAHSTIPEAEFLAELCARTGCGVLLDVNNLYVSAVNHGWDAEAYLAALPPDAVAQYHLAGHTRRAFDGTTLLLDTHDAPVAPAAWQLFDAAVARLGARPTLIEWDSALPPLATLLAEAAHADAVLAAAGVTHAAA
jgi:uncharacterized protein